MSIVSLSPQLPCANPNNAGAKYVHFVEQSWGDEESLFFIPDGDSSRNAAQGKLVPEHRFIGGEPGQGAVARLLRTAAGFGLPVLPSPEYLRGLLTSGDVRRRLRSARVVDLQWEQTAVAIPLVRFLNPQARIVCTLHDVLSQRFARSAASAKGGLKRFRWQWAAAMARLLERRIMASADAVVVLSDKDRALLPRGRAEVHTVNPPLASSALPVRNAQPGRLLFVAAMYRWENAEALEWFITDILSRVREAVPGVCLKVAGAGTPAPLRELAAREGVELLEFVEDLAPLFAEASAVVVPLRHGAGTKFKVIDALAAGVPVVTTSVGAEGIGTPDHYAGVEDDADGFARCVIKALENPTEAEARADSSRRWAQERYGFDQFHASMSRIYVTRKA